MPAAQPAIRSEAARIVVIDDDAAVLEAMAVALAQAGYDEPVTAPTIAAARTAIARPPALVLLDLTLPDGTGEQFLDELAERHPEVPVIVVTAVNDAGTAVRCLRANAADYLVKPVTPEQLIGSVRRSLERSELRDENRRLRGLAEGGALAHPEAFAGLITVDDGLIDRLRYVEAIAPGSQPVLVTGETGSGKELVARAVHAASDRAGRFVPVNVGGLDDTLFSDALFGHRRGAFTGAASDRAGFVEQAEGGTLFLDEIGDIAPASQVKLLRFIQDGEYVPLGTDRPRRARCRLVAATCQDPAALLADGRLRRDLYYRLSAHRVHLPPLRERTGDIPLLVHSFVAEAARDLSRAAPTVPPAVLRHAARAPWRGNVRELRAAVFDAVARAGEALPALAPATADETGTDAIARKFAFGSELPTLDEVRELLIQEALRRAEGNTARAAALLGMSRWGLSKHLRGALGADGR